MLKANGAFSTDLPLAHSCLACQRPWRYGVDVVREKANIAHSTSRRGLEYGGDLRFIALGVFITLFVLALIRAVRSIVTFDILKYIAFDAIERTAGFFI